MPSRPSDSVVFSSGVPIAVRDFGGEGAGIVLVHGLGRTLLDWTVIGPLLARRHHVVALDVRAHGKSGDGPWSWLAAIDDVAAVATSCDMPDPAVVGHSLGGMIATMWGQHHPDCTGVVNLDGHGNPRPDQYVGLDPDWVAERRAESLALRAKTLQALSGPLSAQQVGALVAQQKSVAGQVGAPVELFVEATHRSLDVRDGQGYLRPSPAGAGGDMMAAVDECDMLTLYRQVRCPLLVVAGTRPEADYGDDAAGVAWIHELLAAFRKGVTRDLTDLAAEQANVRFEAVDGSHALPFEQPQLIADLVLDFLSTARAARPASTKP